MEARGLKTDFGRRITFWGGGCDTHAVLNHGTPKEVRRHVREQVSVLRPGGGFVFQQVHNILADVPPRMSLPCLMRCRFERDAGCEMWDVGRIPLSTLAHSACGKTMWLRRRAVLGNNRSRIPGPLPLP